MATHAQPLAGRGIVVTRPVHQSVHLAELITAAGGRAILYPTIEIAAVADPAALIALTDRLHEFDIAVFISPNAAIRAMNLIRSRRELPPGLRLAAVGHAGVRELEQFGLTKVISAERFDSEALLELPQFQNVAGMRIVIFRGEGGRMLLGDTLAARGARVEYAECYRRALPHADAAPLLEAWRRKELHAITVTSSAGLRNLFELAGVPARPWLTKTPLFVPHPRIEQAARELSPGPVVLTGQGDAGLAHGLTQWFAGQR